MMAYERNYQDLHILVQEQQWPATGICLELQLPLDLLTGQLRQQNPEAKHVQTTSTDVEQLHQEIERQARRIAELEFQLKQQINTDDRH